MPRLPRLPRLALLPLAVAALVVGAGARGDARGPVVREAAAGTTASGSGDYTFLMTNADGTPGRWNPCRTIHYRVNASGAPSTAGRDVAEALRRISLATGLTFVRDGRTSVVPRADKDAALPRKGFEHWDSDLIVAWPSATQVKALTGRVSGLGGGEYWPTEGGWRIERGYAIFDRADLATYQAGFGTGRTIGQLYMHELAHAMGLGHAARQPQVMYSAGSSYAQFQAGDRTGLTKVGKRPGCLGS